nr:hypothetical protein [uncultured Mediterraneibacter sp.]
MSITSLIDMKDARIVLNVSRPSPKAILNGEIRYCLFSFFLHSLIHSKL